MQPKIALTFLVAASHYLFMFSWWCSSIPNYMQGQYDSMTDFFNLVSVQLIFTTEVENLVLDTVPNNIDRFGPIIKPIEAIFNCEFVL